MTDSEPGKGRKMSKAGKLYAPAGIAFLIAAVVFVFTMDSPLWISFMALGLVFVTGGATGAFEKKR